MLQNKIFVFSGKFPEFNRAEIEAYATEHGVKVASDLSAKVNYLVAGEKLGDSKRNKANKLGIPILTFEEFQAMINPKAANEFWTKKISGEEAPELFLTIVKALDWPKFNPQKHGEALRNALLLHEELNGLQEAHDYCSEQVRQHLLLLHPYGHDGVINCHQVSPNEQWLATSNWMGADYERGGILQIWELKTGRVVNQIRVRGGIAWSDYNGMEWNPNSEDIALSFNTNAVGVWNPFGATNEPVVYAYVTDGWNRPPAFHWSGDGKSLFINYYYFDGPENSNRKEEDRGCWIDTYKKRGDLSNYATFGYFDDRKEPIYSEAASDKMHFPMPKTGEDFVIFPHLKDGKGAGAFYDRPPGEESPLYINHTDYGTWEDVDPCFPILQDGKELWGIAFKEGSIVVPEDFPAEKYLSFSLGRQWAWPLNWVKHTRVKDLADLLKDKKAIIPPYIAEVLKKAAPKSTGKAKKKKFPTSENKAYKDIVQLTLDTLKGLGSTWDFHVNECLSEVALNEILVGNPTHSFEIIQSIQPDFKGVAAAELAFHCLKRKMPEAEQFLVLAEKEKSNITVYRACAYQCFLAICYHEKGDAKKAAAAEKAALKAQEKEPNDSNLWNLLNLWFMSDQTQKGLDKLKEDWTDKYFSSFDLSHTFYNLVWYGTLDQMIEIINVFKNGESPIIEESDLYGYAAKKIVHDNRFDRLKEMPEHFDSYKDYLVSDCLLALKEAPGPEAEGLFDYFLNEFPFEGYKKDWLGWLRAALDLYPELVKTTISKRDWVLKDTNSWDYYLDGKYETCYELGQVIGQLGLWPDFEREWASLGDDFKVNYLCGIASTTKDTALRDNLLNQAHTLLKSIPSGGSYYENLWAQLAVASQHSTLHSDYLKETLEITFAKDKDLSMEQLVDSLAAEGAIESAYSCWMKIPKGTRKYRINGLFRAFCKAKNYDALFDMLMSLESTDLNDRGQKAIYTLNELNNNRGYKF